MNYADFTQALAMERLEPFASALALDGYEMTVAVSDSAVHVKIEATPNACVDCLVPQKVMEGIVADALRAMAPQPGARQILIQYPTKSTAH